jgi:hypothetical protein
MDNAIFIWWWIFLLAALAVTIVDVYLLLRVVSLCRQIRTLTAETLPAAAGEGPDRPASLDRCG